MLYRNESSTSYFFSFFVFDPFQDFFAAYANLTVSNAMKGHKSVEIGVVRLVRSECWICYREKNSAPISGIFLCTCESVKPQLTYCL